MRTGGFRAWRGKSSLLACAKVPGTGDDLALVPVLEPASLQPLQSLSKDVFYSGSACTATATVQHSALLAQGSSETGKNTNPSLWACPLVGEARGQGSAHTAWLVAAKVQSAASGRRCEQALALGQKDSSSANCHAVLCLSLMLLPTKVPWLGLHSYSLI